MCSVRCWLGVLIKLCGDGRNLFRLHRFITGFGLFAEDVTVLLKYPFISYFIFSLIEIDIELANHCS